MPTTFHCPVSDDLKLVLLDSRHTQALFDLADANRAYLRKWLPWLDNAATVEGTANFIEMGLREAAERHALHTGIWQGDRLCGVIGFHHVDWEHRSATIGYWLNAADQGKGIMTASCRALIQHGFNYFQLHRIVIRCATDNHRSRAIPERLGFTHEGVAREVEWLYDHFVDLSIYSLLSTDELK